MKKIFFIALTICALLITSTAFASVEVLFVVNCTESVTLRKSPSVDSEELTQIPLNHGVVFLEDAGNGFYRVIFGRHSGYVLAEYLSSNEPYDLPQGMLVKRATVFESPSTHSNAIREIISGHWVDYIDDAYFSNSDVPDFYLVRLPGGTYGYITADKVDWNYRRS